VVVPTVYRRTICTKSRRRAGKRKDEILGKTVMGAVVSRDGFIADDNDDVGPLFGWYGNGDVTWSFPGSYCESRSTQASADFMRRPARRSSRWSGRTAAVR
jgi:hypothetical protein